MSTDATNVGGKYERDMNENDEIPEITIIVGGFDKTIIIEEGDSSRLGPESIQKNGEAIIPCVALYDKSKYETLRNAILERARKSEKSLENEGQAK